MSESHFSQLADSAPHRARWASRISSALGMALRWRLSDNGGSDDRGVAPVPAVLRWVHGAHLEGDVVSLEAGLLEPVEVWRAQRGRFGGEVRQHPARLEKPVRLFEEEQVGADHFLVRHRKGVEQDAVERGGGK